MHKITHLRVTKYKWGHGESLNTEIETTHVETVVHRVRRRLGLHFTVQSPFRAKRKFSGGLIYGLI